MYYHPRDATNAANPTSGVEWLLKKEEMEFNKKKREMEKRRRGKHRYHTSMATP